jgi:nitrite reductase/ring-hydroxylating ferredoxin subunit
MANQRIVCKSEDLLEKGKGVRFDLPEFGERVTAFVVRFNGIAYAYINQCAHLPVELDWNANDFFTREQDFLICATHGAHYEPNTGRCVMGPCQGKRLRPLLVNEQNGVISITLDKS